MPFGNGNTHPTNDNFLIYPKRRQKITDFKGQNFSTSSMMLRNKKLKSIQKLRRLHLLRSRKRSGAVTEKSKEQEEEMDGDKSNRYLTYRLALRS